MENISDKVNPNIIFDSTNSDSTEINFLKQKNIELYNKYQNTTWDYIKLLEDGFILKKIYLKGFGKSTPKDGQEVFVNYYAQILEDGRSVDNTLILREPKQILLGKNNCLPGLEKAVKSMIIGEKAKILVFPKYGHLAHAKIKNKIKENEGYDIASFDFDKDIIDYPSNINNEEDFKKAEVKEIKSFMPILYDLELVKVDKPRKNKEFADVEEKMAEVSDLKNEGNQLFREKSFREALIKYNTALNYFFKIPTEDLKTLKILELKQTILLNIVNCHIALLEYNYALKNLPESFEIKESPKCYFYRAIASMNSGDFEQACLDIQKLKSLMPNDKQIKQLEEDFYKIKEKSLNEKKQIFKKGIFNDTINENNNKNASLYIENNNFLYLPAFNPNNICFYLDYLVNNNTKLPQKIKFELFDTFSFKKDLINKQDGAKIYFPIYLLKAIKDKTFINKKLELEYNISLDSENHKNYYYYKIIDIDIMNHSNKTNDANILEIMKFDYLKSKYQYPPVENMLLAIKLCNDNKFYLIILPYKICGNSINNLIVVGRMFYNTENFKSLSEKTYKEEEMFEIQIIDCDRSFNY